LAITPLEIAVGEGRAFGEQVARRPARAQIGSRIHQQLESRRTTTSSHRLLRGHGGEIPTGAVTSDGDAGGIGTQIAGVVTGVFERGERVVRRVWELVLRRAPVLHRENSRTSVAGQVTSDGIVAQP